MDRVTTYSVGHGTRSIEAFLSLLARPPVERLVDVRTAPGSKRHPQFGRDALAEALAEAGVAYEWWGRDLGGFRKPRPDSRNVAIRNPSFRGYADHMGTQAFREALERLVTTSAATPTAFMCAESDWHRCHRRMISDAVVARGHEVVHLLDRGDEPHVLHVDARVVGGWPVYDGA